MVLFSRLSHFYCFSILFFILHSLAHSFLRCAAVFVQCIEFNAPISLHLGFFAWIGKTMTIRITTKKKHCRNFCSRWVFVWSGFCLSFYVFRVKPNEGRWCDDWFILVLIHRELMLMNTIMNEWSNCKRQVNVKWMSINIIIFENCEC